VLVTGGPEEPPVRAEDEHLGALAGRVGRRRHDLDPAVAVEVPGRETAHLRGLAAAADRGRPAGLRVQGAAAELVRRDRAGAADHDVLDTIALEVGDHRRGVDPALAGPAAAKLVPVGVEDERRVEGRDDLEPAVPVEVHERR
jgi:hypothetical protein